MNDDTQWVDSLVSDIAKNYRIVLSNDDPILVTAILNKEILEKAYTDNQSLFVKNSQLLGQQFKAQNKMNDLLIREVSQRLLDAAKSAEFGNESNDVERDSMLINNSTWKALLLLMFMIGLVLGIFVGRLI